MFVYIRADWRKSDSSVNQEPKGKWRWNSNLRLSKDQVSDAFGLNSTKSRETAGVVVLVFFFLKQRGGRRQREQKNYPLDKQNDNFALVTSNSRETHQHLTNERHGIKAIKF